MSKQKEAKGTQRREFLRLAGLGTLAGAAVAASGPAKKAEAAIRSGNEPIRIDMIQRLGQPPGNLFNRLNSTPCNGH